MFPLRIKQSEKLWRRKAVDDVWACNLLMSTLVCLYERSPKLPWSCSWLLLSPVGKTIFSGPNIYAFNSCQYLDARHRRQYACVSELMVLWLLRIFVLSGWILSPTLSVAFLNSHIIFRICSVEVANSITSSANLKFVRQSRSWSLRKIPKSVLQTLYFFLHSVLKGCVEQQAGHRISLFRSFVGSRNFCSLRLSVPKPSGLWKSSSGSWCCSGRCCKIWGPPTLICERWNWMPSWSRPLLSTFWFPTHGISVQFFCMLQCGLLSGRIFWIQPDLQLIYGKALGIFLVTDLSRTVCTTRGNEQIGR